ncbi:hypothetical protein BCR34DRAFT_461170, partial [Clohesyomyces aquaticus]
WKMDNAGVAYCLARTTSQRRKVQFLASVLIVIMIANLIKVFAMTTTLLRHDKPLLTLGDAIQSFLQVPDPTTKGHCLLEADSGISLWKSSVLRGQSTLGARRWGSETRLNFWAGTLSLRRWISWLAPYVNFIFYGLSIPLALCIANAPQLLVSILYFLYNALFTCMLSGLEWSKFSTRRSHLRVSDPVPNGHQKSTFWLQRPYRYSVPLLAASALLRWLVSQTIFFAR